MFGWLFDTKRYEKYVPFLEGLLEETPNPRMTKRWSIGYLIQFEFFFKPVKVKLEYNIVRKTWDISTWTGEEFLFYYDCLDFKPNEAIDFMIARFGLRKIVNEMVQEKNEKDRQKSENKKALLDRYVK